MKSYGWVLIVVGAFLLVYLTAFNLEDKDGDDASSIAYHILGRDENIQVRYALYQSMMDGVLSPLPPDQDTIRIVAYTSTAIATGLMVIVLLGLTFSWIPDIPAERKWLIAALLLIASPELFYFGLIYSPTLIAMMLVLLSHLVLRQTSYFTSKPPRQSDTVWVVVSIVLFAFGSAFRWNIAAYFAVILVDFLLALRQSRGDAAPWQHYAPAIALAVAAPVLVFLAILISGISPGEIVDSFAIAEDVAGQSGADNEAGFTEITPQTFASLLSLTTPIFVLFGAIGFVRLIRERNRLLILVITGLVVTLPWLTSGVPKFIIVAIPGMVLCFVVGLLAAWDYFTQPRLKMAAQGAMIAIALAPWIIGAQLSCCDSAWGPDFGKKPFEREETETVYSIHIGPGAAFPTPEYVRPIGGHAFILFGGHWRNLTDEDHEERVNMVETSLEMDIPILVLSWSPDYFTNELLSRGFDTTDSNGHPWQGNEEIVSRSFVDEEGNQALLLFYEVTNEVTDEEMEQILEVANEYDRATVYGYSRTMSDLYQRAPDTLTVLGTRTAILDLEQLAMMLAEQ